MPQVRGGGESAVRDVPTMSGCWILSGSAISTDKTVGGAVVLYDVP